MSLPRRHPIIEVGDTQSQFQAWRVDGLTDKNSDRGQLYVSSVPVGALVRIDVYSDFARTTLVAQGTGATSARVTATEVSGSGLEVSAWATGNAANVNLELIVQLATLEDLEEAEDKVTTFFTEDPPEQDFNNVARRVMSQFFKNIQRDFPPPQRDRAPFDLPSASPVQIDGARGRPDVDAVEIWSLNVENDWEIVGIQNPTDWKEWALNWTLYLLWKRKAGSAEDPMLARSETYRLQANSDWRDVPVLIDRSLDRTPDRQIRRRSRTISRG